VVLQRAADGGQLASTLRRELELAAEPLGAPSHKLAGEVKGDSDHELATMAAGNDEIWSTT
jgi:hypothetical protein